MYDGETKSSSVNDSTALMIVDGTPHLGAKLNLPVMRLYRGTTSLAVPVMTGLIRDNYDSNKRKRGPEKFIGASSLEKRSRDISIESHLFKVDV